MGKKIATYQHSTNVARVLLSGPPCIILQELRLRELRPENFETIAAVNVVSNKLSFASNLGVLYLLPAPLKLGQANLST